MSCLDLHCCSISTGAVLSNSFSVYVRNRTATELQQDVSSEQACDMEENFIRQHAELKDIGDEYKGMSALSRKLVQIQDQCIQSHLPILQKEVSNA